MPKPTEPPAAPIRISDNTIIDGKFFCRGTPLPYASVTDMPEILRPLVVTGEPEEDEEPAGARGAFQTNTLYEVTDDNRLGRAVRRRVERQVAELQTANEEADWIEDEAANTELPPEIARDLQEAHESHVGLQAAQAAADAEGADQIADAVIASQEPPQLFVKRGSRHYVDIHRTKLRRPNPFSCDNPTAAGIKASASPMLKLNLQMPQ